MLILLSALLAGLVLGGTDGVILAWRGTESLDLLTCVHAMVWAGMLALPIAAAGIVITRFAAEPRRWVLALLIPMWLLVVWNLGAGAGISVSPWRFPALGGLAIVGSLGLWIGVRLGHRAGGAGGRGAVLILAMAAPVLYASGFLYPESYSWLHGYLLVLCVCVLAVLGRRSLRLVRTPPSWSAPALAAILVILAIALPTSNRRRAQLYRNTQGARNITLFAGKFGLLPGQGDLLSAAMRGGGGEDVSRYRLPACESRAKTPHDVIVLTIDAVRSDRVGLAGAPTRMPATSALGQDGVHFLNAYAPSPATATSLLSILSGRSALDLREEGLFPQTLASELSRLGYEATSFHPFTSVTRRMLAETDAKKLGFAVIRKERRSSDMVAHIVETLEAEPERPQFFYAHLPEPHAPYQGHPGHDFGRGMQARYESELAYVDAQIARLVEQLGRMGRLENTIIAITADHGEAFFEHGVMAHGTTLYEEMIRVPLVLRIPGLRVSPRSEPVSLLDLAPTILASLGCGWTGAMEGESLLRDGVLQGWGRPVVVRQYDTSERGEAFVRRAAVRIGNDKLIVDLQTSVIERYQLAADPKEAENLVGRDAPLQRRLMAALLASRRQIAALIERGSATTLVALTSRVRSGNTRALAQSAEALGALRKHSDDAIGLIDALGESDAPGAARALRHALSQPKLPPGLRAAATLAEASHGGIFGQVQLMLLAADTGAAVADRMGALQRLQHGPGTWPGLRDILRTLSGADERAVGAAAALLLCEFPEERVASAASLRHRYPGGGGLDELAAHQYQPLLDCLSDAGTDDDVAYLMMLYETFVAKELHIAYETLAALAATGDDRVLAVLIPQSKLGYEPIRIAALEAMAALGTPAARQHLHQRAMANEHVGHAPGHFLAILRTLARSRTLPMPEPGSTGLTANLVERWGPTDGASHLLCLEFAGNPAPLLLRVEGRPPIVVPAQPVGAAPLPVFIDWPGAGPALQLPPEAFAALVSVTLLSFP